jgi:hypothetical protein
MSVTCRYCKGPIDLVQQGWSEGEPAYCSRHHVLADNDPFMVGQHALDYADWLHNLPDDALIHWPWAAVNELAGPLVPGRLTYVAAFPGNGKTTFLTHCLHHWLSTGKSVLYLPLEADPGEIYVRLACLELGINADEALGFRLRMRANNGDERAAQQLVDLQELYQRMRFRHDVLERLHIVPMQTLSLGAFHKALTVAQLRESSLVVIDHVDHVEHDEHETGPEIALSNRLQSMALQAAKHLAIPMCLATQLNSGRTGGDRLAHYRPPLTDWLYNKGKKEQMAANILGLSRVMDPNADLGLLSDVRSGRADVSKVILPERMGVTGMKLRYGGAMKERTVQLRYAQGALRDLDGPEQRDLLAQRHGTMMGSPSDRRFA